MKIRFCDENSWFSTLECLFSIFFCWSPPSSNFWLCLFETQATAVLTQQSIISHPPNTQPIHYGHLNFLLHRHTFKENPPLDKIHSIAIPHSKKVINVESIMQFSHLFGFKMLISLRAFCLTFNIYLDLTVGSPYFFKIKFLKRMTCLGELVTTL